MMHIDKETYKTTPSNRYKTQIAKTQIIIGTSLRKDSNHIIRLQHKDYGKAKKWNTYTVSRIGTVYEHFDPKYHADFIGIKEVDKRSISIVLENMGCLFQSNNLHVNWLNEICDERNVIEKEWLGYNHWEKFTDEQLSSTTMLCQELCNRFNIPKTVMKFHHYNKDTVKFKGIAFRSNYIEDSSDVNPLFEVDEFSKMLHA